MDETVVGAVGGPVTVGWREGTLTRAKELESLCAWVLKNGALENSGVLADAVARHIEAARQAAKAARPNPRRRLRVFRHAPLLERAMSNLDAAEAQIINFASPEYVLGQFPCLLRHVQSHLVPADPRRQEFERIARRLGVKDPDHPLLPNTVLLLDDRKKVIEDERGTIAAVVRGASSAALREQVQVRSFRNVLIVATVFMTMLAVGVAIVGILRPTMIPMCFAPEESGQAIVVCPTAQSEPFSISPPTGAGTQQAAPLVDIDDRVRDSAKRLDILVIELVGLAAAAVAAAAAIRGVRGSSERYGLPITLAVLKLPTGALTAFLGLLLMRGQFVPGLTALDTSAQILAWALVFGYAQELFTRLVDRQGHTVLETVRGADKPQPGPGTT